ncbi:unnamed protein product, partial [marine sediment metagenome]
SRKVFNAWKPIIVMTKPPVSPTRNWVVDSISGGGRDKQHHEWGQDAQEAMYWIEHLTAPGELVVDPFCGGGTIPVACKLTRRRWLATEIDEGNAAVARKRLAETVPTEEKAA